MSLERLLGTWNCTMQHVQIAEPIRARQTYQQVLNGAFVLMHATHDHPDVPDALALLDGSSLHYFDVRGVTRVFDLDVDDSGWSMIRRDDDFWQRSSVSFVSPDRMEGTGDTSHDAGRTWEHDFTMTYVRA